MAKQTQKGKTQQKQAPPQRQGQVAVFHEARLPYHPAIGERFGVDKSSWRALVEAIYPNATSPDSVILALSYCKARGLDPFKRPVHIVPIYSRAEAKMIDSIWPGIAEVRTTAMRTGQYAGQDRIEWGPLITRDFRAENGETIEVEFPEYAQVTVYKMIDGQRVPVHGPEVYWMETYAKESRKSDVPNEMWRKRPRGQIGKCAEAAALRTAFPEELGNEYIPEEAAGMEIGDAGHRQRVQAPPGPAPAKQPKRSDYADVVDVDDTGAPVAQEAEATAAETATDAPSNEGDKAKAAEPEQAKSPEKAAGFDVEVFANAFIAALERCGTVDGVTDLKERHKNDLAQLAEAAPERRKEIDKAITKKIQGLL